MAETSLQDQLSKMRREAEERDAQNLAAQAGLKYLPPEKTAVSLEALALISEKQAREAHLGIIAAADKKIAAATHDPGYAKTKEALLLLKEKKFEVSLYIVSLSTLEYIFSFYRFSSEGRSPISGSVTVSHGGEGEKKDLSSLPKVKQAMEIALETGKVSEVVEAILSGAIANRASDIHIEPSKERVKLRYRIDGLLNDVSGELPIGSYRAIISRIKMLSNLKLNVRDEPQDGRFTISLPQKNVEVRVAIAPSEFGEVVVMRLLDPDAINLSLKDLGLREDDLKIIEEQLQRPYGMALNTGPTGSGKTTTLYAFLRHKVTSEIKIITIEDPIEYHLDGIEQTQVDNEAGYTFASGLRSLMRQDPDVILVGEIRDKETAEIAVQAALTGHLVFSTVHANEASGAVPRLIDLGVKANSLAPALNLLIAQRLIRRLCAHCKKEEPVSQEDKERLQIFFSSLPSRVNASAFSGRLQKYSPQGCERCNGSGYKGRVGIYELLVITPKLQELISKEAGQIEIAKTIAASDFVSMQEDGILKVVSGMTTFEEVEDATGKIEWSRNKKSATGD